MPRKPQSPQPPREPLPLSPEQAKGIAKRTPLIVARVQAQKERAKRKAEGTFTSKRPVRSKQKTLTSNDEIRRQRRKDAFVKVLSKGYSVAKACRTVGIERKSAYEWRENDPEFKRRWDQAFVDGLDTLEDVVRDASDRDWRAAEATLKAKRHEVWSPRQKTDVTLNASEGLLAVLQAIAPTARGLPAAEREPEPETSED